MIHYVTHPKKSTLPILLGGIGSAAVVLSGAGLLARRRFRARTVDLSDVDLSADEWRGVVEFEESNEEGA